MADRAGPVGGTSARGPTPAEALNGAEARSPRDMIDTRGAGPLAVGSRSLVLARDIGPEGEEIRMAKKPTRTPTNRTAAAARDGANGAPRDAEQDRRLERRLERAEERIEHLEAALEGLQDALYRLARREDESRDEMMRRTEPERIARELSDDARRRGL